jgi:hypothetical protein
VALDPASIPKFAHELAIPRVYAPRQIVERGQIVRQEFSVSVAQSTAPMLPPDFPATTVIAYGDAERAARDATLLS